MASPLISASGSWSLAVRPASNTSYRAVFEGATGLGESASSTVGLAVSNRVTRKVSDSTPAVRQRVVITGVVGPAQRGARVYLQRSVRGKWVNVTSATLNASSRYTMSWRPTTSVDYRFRVVSPASRVTARGYSPTFVLRVG